MRGLLSSSFSRRVIASVPRMRWVLRTVKVISMYIGVYTHRYKLQAYLIIPAQLQGALARPSALHLHDQGAFSESSAASLHRTAPFCSAQGDPSGNQAWSDGRAEPASALLRSRPVKPELASPCAAKIARRRYHA